MVTIDSPLMYDICALFYTDLNSLAYILIFCYFEPLLFQEKNYRLNNFFCDKRSSLFCRAVIHNEKKS